MAGLFERIKYVWQGLPEDNKSSLNEGEATNANPEYQTLVDKINDSRKKKSLDEMGRRTSLALASTYTETVKSRKDFLTQFNKIRSYYITDAILLTVAEDALTPDITTGEVVQIETSREDLSEEIENFQNLFNIDQIVNDIVIDLLGNGEHTLLLNSKENEGVVDIIDNVDQSSIVAFYKNGLPHKFIRKEGADLKVYPPYRFAHFVLGKHKLRVKIGKEFDIDAGEDLAELLKNEELPAYARVGRPLLYGVISKIKELMLLEQLVPATRISQITTGSIVGVQLPQSTDPKEGFEIARTYENALNKKIGLDRNNNEITVSEIMSVAGMIKVLPSIGDKGQLNTLDVKENRAVDDIISSVRDLREVICTSIGFPPEILFGGEERAENLKRHARYLRKLKYVQTSISAGLLQIVYAHLYNKGLTLKQGDIKISFRNELVAIEELEKLEYNDSILNTIQSMYSFVQDLMENEHLEGMITKDQFKNWVKESMSMMKGYDNIFYSGDKEDSDNPDNPDNPDDTTSSDDGEESSDKGDKPTLMDS